MLKLILILIITIIIQIKKKINDDSIETIPINDEKKITNIGFRKILKNY